MWLLRTIVVLTWVLTAMTSARAQSTFVEFFTDEYPSSLYKIRFTNYFLDSLKIKLIVVNSKKAGDDAPTFCRLWLKVLRGDSVINQVYFNNQDGPGHCSAFYLPVPQPSVDHFMLVKYNDTSGRTVIVNRHGKIVVMEGGKYFITRDNRFLFSIRTPDNNGLAVYDFKTNSIVFKNEELDLEARDWYFQDGRYFCLDQDAEPDEETETDSEFLNFALLQFPIMRFDFSLKQLKRDKLTYANLREDSQLLLLPETKKIKDCYCN